MKQELWRRAENLFHAALDRAPDVRPSFLDEACGEDTELRRHVERLLAHDERAGTFLEQPVVADLPGPSAGRDTLVGRQHGPYRILSLLGAGGMGEVYQAHDVTLGRDVALKTLPPEFALDPARLARFRREARALAALNHPNIETIHGLEESADLHFLVLELVEGETPRGPLPLAEVLDLASQVADALQAAHEHGIVHRDLKPANLKVTPQGRLKVLDFGLAKAMAGPADVMPAPVQAQAAAREGTVLGHVVGTPGYMSPEQARGAQVDQRTDIWAFGCLLYELLTGKRAFDIVAGAGSVAAAPGLDWQALPAGTPDGIRALLRQCLQEDPSRRLQTMAEARAAIEEVRPSSADTHGEPPRIALPLDRGRRWLTAALSAVAVLAVAVAVVVIGSSRPSLAPARFALTMPGQIVLNAATVSNLAVASDGSGVVYVGTNGSQTQLYWHDLHGPDGWALEGTVGSHTPFLSPDGRWLAFYRDGKILKVPLKAGRVPGGNRAAELVSSDALRGAAWSADGAIVYATLGGGLRLVASDGGPVRQLTEPDPSKGEADHRWPVFLPGGRHVLFTVHHASWRSDRSFVAVLSLETGRVTRILEGGVHARYLPTGHLVFGRDGVLLAVPLDVKRLAVGGIPTPVVNHVRFTPTAGGFDFDVAANGTLVYAGDAAEPPRNGLVWVTREGSVEPALPDRQPYMHINFALSPDGHRVAANVNGRPYASIWIYDLRDGRRQRLNVDADCYSPVWSPDGDRLAFTSNRDGALNLYAAAASGGGAPERLAGSRMMQRPRSWSPDGRFLAYELQTPKNVIETHVLEVDGRGTWRWGPEGGNVSQPTFSPDGRFVAYQAQESGAWEVCVRPFPGPGPEQRVSPQGGLAPLWSGSEIYYLERPRPTRIMSRHVESTSPLRLAPPRVAFSLPFALGNDNPYLSLAYDVEPGGRRVLVVQQDEREAKGTNSLDVITNWGEDVKARLRGRR